jgi:hypothetical protein
VSLIINGFCKDVFLQLPMEFAVEAQRLLGMKLGRQRWIRASKRIVTRQRFSLGESYVRDSKFTCRH